MSFISVYSRLNNYVVSLSSTILLALRLVLAYGFYEPAINKWSDIRAVGSWFADMGIPMPLLNAYLAASTEILGVLLLTVGLAVQLISVPLIFTMIVAILTVHISNGFAAGDNGIEIPLYYMLMLGVLLTNGAGKFSADHWILSKK